MKEVSAVFRLLGDEVRLRILRLLSVERLNVSELTSILGIAQSGVSRHLGLLRDAGLVEESRAGGYAWYRRAPDEAGPSADLWRWLDAQWAARKDPSVRADDARLKEVLRLRKESFARHRLDGAQLVPGRSWAAWARALGHLMPPLTVGDLGCGEGYLAIEMARWASRVIAVDRSPEVLRAARGLAGRRGVRNITWKRGDIEALPLDDRSIDLALLSQALHHAEEPPRALAEARRVTRPGGRLLVLDLRAHTQEWVRERLGDRWLGFGDAELERLLIDAGFDEVRLTVGARLKGDPFTVIVASAVRPEAATAEPPSPAEHSRSTT